MASRRPAAAFLLIAASGVQPLAPGPVSVASAQTAAEEQIAGAVLAAPESLRDEATVLGVGGEPREGDPLTVLREGSNEIVCLADDPSEEGFHVACYHRSMERYMALGRRLRSEGADRDSVRAARQAAVDAGEIEPPAAALWSLSSPSDVDPAAGPGPAARRLSVVYVPGADADDIGLPTRPDGDSPWLMLPGTPWAHIMIPR